MPRTLSPKAGVSLLELLVVIVIIGIISAIIAINVLPAQDQALVARARADIAQLESALEQYKLDNLTYPSVDQGLEALVVRPDGLSRPERYRSGGYLRRLEDDPWGNPYQYVHPGEFGVFDVYSLGADGRPGGEGLDADIGNWREDDRAR